MNAAACPTWCTDHDGFDDGSQDWHRGADETAGGHVFYLSTGTPTGEPAVFIVDHPTEGMTLDAAEQYAAALLELAKAARASS